VWRNRHTTDDIGATVPFGDRTFRSNALLRLYDMKEGTVVQGLTDTSVSSSVRGETIRQVA
jgi:hypothetical protein